MKAPVTDPASVPAPHEADPTETDRPPSIMIVAGEISGDMHAAPVVTALRKQLPDAVFYGIGGHRMRQAGVETLFDVQDMAVMGFVEVLRKFPFFRKVFHEMVDLAYRSRPDAVILVDYPGFNLRLAARLHAVGVNVIYYICPQVWAWNRARIPKMAAMVDKLITIFPFEADHFSGTGLDIEFAGHPLVDEADALRARPPAPLPWSADGGLALLPGSRRHEIERMLPVMWQAAGRLAATRPDLECILAAPGEEEATLIRQQLERCAGGPPRHHVVAGQTREVLRQARAALVASGTATIETALLRCPMVIAYKVAPLTYWTARCLVRVPHIGMVNIVAGKRVCPEFIQRRATPAALAEAVAPLLDNTPQRQTMIDELDRVASRLGRGGASEKAADMMARVVRKQLNARKGGAISPRSTRE